MTAENKKAIAAYLAAKPNIEKVYLNKDGEWLFVERPGYDEILTREEILSDATADNTTNKTKKA